MSSDLTVGVLSLHTSKESKAILNAVDDLGYDTAWLRAENTVVDISDGEVTLEPHADIVVNRLLLSKEEQPAEALGLATTNDRTISIDVNVGIDTHRSRSTDSPGAVVAPADSTSPGERLVLTPVFAPGPTTTPYFRRPVETRSPFTVCFTSAPSCRRFAT